MHRSTGFVIIYQSGFARARPVGAAEVTPPCFEPGGGRRVSGELRTSKVLKDAADRDEIGCIFDHLAVSVSTRD